MPEGRAGALTVDDLKRLLPEGRHKEFDSFVSFFEGRRQKWHQRPFVDGMPRLKDYLDGDISLKLFCRRAGTDVEKSVRSLTYKFVVHRGNKNFVASRQCCLKIQLSNGSFWGRKHKHVVLVPVVDLGDEPQHLSTVFVGSNLIQNEVVSPLEGGLYRSLLQGTYHTLAIIRAGKRAFVSVGVTGALEPHPATIKCGSETKHDVAGGQRKPGRDGVVLDDHAPGLLVQCDRGGISVILDELIDSGFKPFDVLLGPSHL